MNFSNAGTHKLISPQKVVSTTCNKSLVTPATLLYTICTVGESDLGEFYLKPTSKALDLNPIKNEIISEIYSDVEHTSIKDGRGAIILQNETPHLHITTSIGELAVDQMVFEPRHRLISYIFNATSAPDVRFTFSIYDRHTKEAQTYISTHYNSCHFSPFPIAHSLADNFTESMPVHFSRKPNSDRYILEVKNQKFECCPIAKLQTEFDEFVKTIQRLADDNLMLCNKLKAIRDLTELD